MGHLEDKSTVANEAMIGGSGRFPKYLLFVVTDNTLPKDKKFSIVNYGSYEWLF